MLIRYNLPIHNYRSASSRPKLKLYQDSHVSKMNYIKISPHPSCPRYILIQKPRKWDQM